MLAFAITTPREVRAEPEPEIPPGWRLIGGEPEFEGILPPGIFPVPLAIDFFSDCTGSAGDPGSCGPPAARWVPPDNPPEFCSAQASRPAGITAQAFRDAVEQAAATWNSVEAAIGARYVGDCSTSSWRYEDGVNQVGWDDGRQAVVGAEAGVTRGSWFLLPGNAKEFAEADIVLEGSDVGGIPPVCFQSVVTHEMGHALGFGHSDNRADLMYPAFDPDDLSTCITSPSAAERARLQSLYGVDRMPAVTFGLAPVAAPGQSVMLRALASDPEGGPLTLDWTQTAGPPVTLQSSGLVATFQAPTTNATLAFQVRVFDQFLHEATASVAVTVGSATSAPNQAPSLKSFLGSAEGGANAQLTWSEVPGALQYELCSRPAGSAAAFACQDLQTTVVDVTWDTVVGTAPVPGELRVFTSGGRETALRGCNALGCSLNGTGGITGGLRWPAANVDFDYFVLAFDTPTLKFTVAGVVNVSGAPRSFNLNTGPVDDPSQERIRSCGTLQPGAACLGFLGPSEQHFEYVDVTSRASGAPSTEHRIKVR